MRTYIAPNLKGEICGIRVKAVSLQRKNITTLCNKGACDICAIKKMGICFTNESIVNDKGKTEIYLKSADTRPACMGNDRENLHNTPVYYEKI